jgi:phosphotriesterase-related protein
MKKEELTGKVQTVLGPIDCDSLGITMIHEHLLIDMSSQFVPPDPNEIALAHEPVQLKNLLWVRLHPVSNLDNMRLTDEELVVKDSMLYKLAGGSTIVEVTTAIFDRDPDGLVRIAQETGLNIVMGTGHHVARTHPSKLATMNDSEIIQEMVTDITEGAGQSGVRAGIIGEIGCSIPLQNNERRVLRCCAAVQQLTGAAVYIHPSPHDDAVMEIPKLLAEAGADLRRVIIGHVDISGFSEDTRRRLLDMGCFIAFDTFGFEGFIQPPHESRVVELSDVVRIKDIMSLINEGYIGQILISQDVATKERLAAYGGFGYAHILRDIVPVMKSKGLSENQLQTLLVENPTRILVLT